MRTESSTDFVSVDLRFFFKAKLYWEVVAQLISMLSSVKKLPIPGSKPISQRIVTPELFANSSSLDMESST